MTDWLLETLVWTGILIAMVLLVRRPVARWFGPQVAYALWLIPMLRLLLPPIQLPAWMNPAPEPAAATEELTFANLDPAIPVATTDGAAVSEAAAPLTSAPNYPVPSFELGPFVEAGFAVWLLGAAIFLYMRFVAYFRLRDELLEQSSEVGRHGKVRLVETDGTEAPLAFGVIDKVIALPRGFLAQHDRQARDLALAHEMAHHAGRDLLVNVLVQPLFAMHWFNPLGKYGWLALRRDQEAACDARVLAAEPEEARSEALEAYANLIVSTAAGPNVALAAPMACPVLGEKSIIHRLRSLKMTDTSNGRRIAGRLMLGAAVIALPLTASISYAANEVPEPPAPPAPEAPVAPPAPPAPLAPPAPPAPPAPLTDQTIIEIDPDVEVSADESREENVFVLRARDEAAAERNVRREHRRVVLRERRHMNDEEVEKVIDEMRRGLAEAHRAMDELPHIIEESLEASRHGEGRTVVKMHCDESTDEVTTTLEREDGTRTVMICKTRIMAQALEGLREAREQMAENREMTGEMRERVLSELDRQIERWEARSR